MGSTFVILGALENMTRVSATEKIKKAGGKVTGSLSRNTDFLLLGCSTAVSPVESTTTFQKFAQMQSAGEGPCLLSEEEFAAILEREEATGANGVE